MILVFILWASSCFCGKESIGLISLILILQDLSFVDINPCNHLNSASSLRAWRGESNVQRIRAAVPAPRPGHEVAFVISNQSSVGLSVLVSRGLCVKYAQGFTYLRKSVTYAQTHSLEEWVHQSNNKSKNTGKIRYGLTCNADPAMEKST